jgi:hypothetical protein
MLTPAETKKVVDALAFVLANQGDARAFISSTFMGNDAEMLHLLPTSLTLPQHQASFVVSRCLDGQWSRNPTLMDQLLDTLVNNYQYAFQTQLDRVRQGPSADPNPNPAVALWLATHMPFFSRQNLRPVLKNLVNSDIQPILRIVGPPENGDECGKSYTRELVEHIRETRTDLRVAHARIEKGLGPSSSVESVAMALVAPTGKDLDTMPKRSTSSYAKILTYWILNASLSTPDRWIYVLDGFDQQDVQAETKELVHALATELASGEYRKRIRLLLVAYGSPLLGIPAVKILNEQVPPATAVTRKDIADCLAAHYADLGKHGHPGVPQTEIDTVADALIQQAPVGPAKRLEHLNTVLTQLRIDDLRRLGVIP